jgi:hypothetical protein
MIRVHQRQAMSKNVDAYYRGLENMINHSKFNKFIVKDSEDGSTSMIK